MLESSRFYWEMDALKLIFEGVVRLEFSKA